MRRMTTATASAALALALTACGSGDGGPGPTAGEGGGESTATSTSDGGSSTSTSSSTSSATGTSTEESSARTSEDPTSTSTSTSTSTDSTSTDTGSPFDADEFTAKLEAAVEENPTVTIDVTIEDGSGRQTATASGQQDLGNDALDMEVDMNGQELGYRLVDGRYYLAQPPKWVPVTEDSTNPVVAQTLDQVQLLSMRTQFDAFVAGVEQAGDKGTEEIDGVTTRHYTAMVDTAKAQEQLGTERDPNAPEALIYDVWLDEDDLIRRMVLSQDGSKATLTATDWGEPVDIRKPKDSELADAG